MYSICCFTCTFYVKQVLQELISSSISNISNIKAHGFACAITSECFLHWCGFSLLGLCQSVSLLPSVHWPCTPPVCMCSPCAITRVIASTLERNCGVLWRLH
ncbi:hypothetical protein BT93_L4323 [Corymbia citriodora subsp. variegata]|uniref:Uncharacterized protein n=1 Tax=Corymbia citriodora subsp. variegata TaxID=360336 RepID=A0A8T0CUC2_CORYI|nr:hypothetical protein BT93_L4323 [Corymbia citriodora subsp. variegata]